MALYYPEDKVAASRYVKQAIPLMVKNDIVPNPCNYALWYSYVSNRDVELKRALDASIAEQGTCPASLSRRLFEHHIIREESEFHKNIQDSLNDVVSDLMDDAANTREITECYSKDLAASLDTLTNDENPEHLKNTVKQLIEATEREKSIVSGFEQQIKAAELEIQSLRQQLKEREQEATVDQLTNVANRRAFDQRLYQLAGSNSPVTLILVDLDHFKRLNDTFGHLLGDKVLQGMGTLLSKVCPKNGMAARYGGEEFAFLLEGDIEQGFALAEETRQMMQKLSIKKKNSDELIDNITASFGVAQMAQGEFPEQLIERADAALYQAKEAGRNTVCKAA